jgi:hypothetical protein
MTDYQVTTYLIARWMILKYNHTALREIHDYKIAFSILSYE